MLLRIKCGRGRSFVLITILPRFMAWVLKNMDKRVRLRPLLQLIYLWWSLGEVELIGKSWFILCLLSPELVRNLIVFKKSQILSQTTWSWICLLWRCIIEKLIKNVIIWLILLNLCLSLRFCWLSTSKKVLKKIKRLLFLFFLLRRNVSLILVCKNLVKCRIICSWRVSILLFKVCW